MRSGWKWRTLSAVVAMLVSAGLVASPVRAETKGKREEEKQAAGPRRPPKHRLYYWNALGLRANPLGAADTFRMSYRYRLFDSDSLLFRDTFLGLGVVPTLSPAWWRVGGFLEVQPLAALRITAQYDYVRYMGAFKLMQSFPDATANFSDTVLDQLQDQGRTYVTSGTQFTLKALLQAKVGPIAIRSNFQFIRVDTDLRAGDTVFYDILYDLLAPGTGWMLVNDTDLIYLTKFGFAAGVRYSIGHAWYSATQLPSGDNPNTPTQRVGPFFAYRFFSKPNAMFNNPTVALFVQWWIKHRWRTGADVSQGLPYLAIAFTFDGDFWTGG